MRKITAMSCVTLGVLVQALAGCGTPTEVPAGRWIGQGTYVDYEAVLEKDAAAPEQRDHTRTYRTTLQITPTRAFGREAFRLYILSERGTLFNVPDEETKLEAVLVKLRALERGAVLYAAVPAGDVGSLEAAPEAADSLPPRTIARAVAMPIGGGLLLQLQYVDPAQDISACFADALLFQSDRVLKAGVYAVSQDTGGRRKAAEVWWAEELRPAR